MFLRIFRIKFHENSVIVDGNENGFALLFFCYYFFIIFSRTKKLLEFKRNFSRVAQLFV